MMNWKNYRYSDLETLASIFTGSKCQVFAFDPNDQIIFDLSSPDEDLEPNNGPLVLFNFGGDIIQYKMMELTDFDFIFDMSGKSQVDFTFRRSYRLIKNSKGELKYFHPSENKSGNFLSFYQPRTIPTRLKKFTLSLLSKVCPFVFPSMVVHSKIAPRFEHTLPVVNPESLAIYTGAAGYLRKAVAIHLNRKGETNFAKLAVSKASELKLRHEGEHLYSLQQTKFKEFAIPELVPHGDPITLVTKQMKLVSTSKRIPERMVYRVLSELSQTNLTYGKIGDTTFFDEQIDNLFWLKNNRKKTPKDTLKHLGALLYKHNTKTNVYCSLSHGDFAKWNMVPGEKLGLIDWEMADKQRPLLYDFFHFEVQRIIESKNASVQNLIASIEENSRNPKIKYIIKKYRIDLMQYFMYYATHKLLQQCVLSELQKTTSEERNQVESILAKVLKYFALKKAHPFARKEFLQAFQHFMIPKRYSTLKFMHQSFDELDNASDLDLLIDRSELTGIIQFINKNELVGSVKTIKKSFMTVIKIFLVNGEFLSIDLIHKFKRKSLVYLSAEELLDNSRHMNGIQVLSRKDEIGLLQSFYWLNKASVPKKYQLKYDYDSIKSSQMFSYSKIKHIELKRSIANSMSILSRIKELALYIKDSTSDVFSSKGVVITFSGVDGAGKTTVIEHVSKELKTKYRKEVVLLRHRPGILPILSTLKHGSKDRAEHAASINLPRQGKNKSKIGSALRFSYYFADYQVGQVIIFFKYILRGKTVIYDRYYFDFVNDAKRSNISINRGVVKSLYRLIYHPKYNFYLYNHPAVILSRKKELDKNSIIKLHENYSDLFNEYQKRDNKNLYDQIRNDEIENTVSQIMTKLKSVA